MWFEPRLRVRYAPRPDLLALWRQYYDYGRWKNRVIRRHPASLRPRQLAPPALMVGLSLSALAALAGRKARRHRPRDLRRRPVHRCVQRISGRTLRPCCYRWCCR